METARLGIPVKPRRLDSYLLWDPHEAGPDTLHGGTYGLSH